MKISKKKISTFISDIPLVILFILCFFLTQTYFGTANYNLLSKVYLVLMLCICAFIIIKKHGVIRLSYKEKISYYMLVVPYCILLIWSFVLCALEKQITFSKVISEIEPRILVPFTACLMYYYFKEKERKYFTLVLKSMLTLANAKFLFGCRGSNLDILAREPLWEDGVDYRCGTGHGVGYFLGVHEGPNAFRWRSNPENLDAVLQPGMVITDEPGVYVPGKYGIRTENMLICKKWQQNEYGAFLHFEPLTLVPIDLDGVDLSLFNEKEKQLLTDYQQFVYDTLSPHLNEEESAWLHTLTL